MSRILLCFMNTNTNIICPSPPSLIKYSLILATFQGARSVAAVGRSRHTGEFDLRLPKEHKHSSTLLRKDGSLPPPASVKADTAGEGSRILSNVVDTQAKNADSKSMKLSRPQLLSQGMYLKKGIWCLL